MFETEFFRRQQFLKHFRELATQPRCRADDAKNQCSTVILEVLRRHHSYDTGSQNVADPHQMRQERADGGDMMHDRQRLQLIKIASRKRSDLLSNQCGYRETRSRHNFSCQLMPTESWKPSRNL